MLQRASALARAAAEPPDPVIRSSSFPPCLASSQNPPLPLPRVVVPDIFDNAQSCIPVRFLVRKKNRNLQNDVVRSTAVVKPNDSLRIILEIPA